MRKARIYDGGSNRRRSKRKIIQPCDRYVPLSRYRQSADSKIVVVLRIIQDPGIALVFLGIRILNRYSVCLFFACIRLLFSLTRSPWHLFISSLVRTDKAIARVYSLFILFARQSTSFHQQERGEWSSSISRLKINQPYGTWSYIGWILLDFLGKS